MTATRVLKLRIPEPPSRGGRFTRALAWLTSTVIYTLALGLTLGALVHIVTVFAIPLLGSSNAVSRLTQAGHEMPAIAQDISESSFTPPWPDPAFVMTFCQFDLTQGPVRISARAADIFAGLSLHGAGGGVLYAVTDEIAQDEILSVVVLTPDQALDYRVDISGEVRFIAPVISGIPTTSGVAVYRVMSPLPSLREKARTVAGTLRCEGLQQ